ncbi:unnamed protein product [Candidula unifasciata]|uniref:G-protein coupled receptors family 1 profile domain-containing protein n=1 Tax=Candidula unifasciata TaxID=100452 RepID=A0A8S3YL82_9EUPU|nr:unnamed protein product [Candidula unifasciata]
MDLHSIDVMENTSIRQMQIPGTPKLQGSIDLENHGYLVILTVSVCLVSLIVITILTNFIVVVVFVTRENRKRSKNIYLANLSLIDLIIGVTVMPVTMLSMLNRNWNLPNVACRIHLVALHSLVFASLLAVLLVSADRWYSICYPFTYRVRPTGRIALYAVITSWVFSFTLHVPFVGVWDFIIHENWLEIEVGLCQASRRQHPGITLLTMIKYILPHVTMLLLKCSLYRKIKKRKNVNVRRSISSVDTAAFCLIRASMSETAMNALAEAAETNLNIGPRVRITCPPIERRNTMDLLPPLNPTRPGASRSWSGSPDQRLSFPCHPTLKRRMSLQDCLLSHNKRNSRRFPNGFSNDGNNINRRATIGDLAKNLLEKQDSKAAWFLSLLLATSITCWTPWTIFSLCHQFVVIPSWLNSLALWVLLANSTANPFLYGLLNKDFRRVVSSWLYLRGSKKKRLKTALRMLSWQMAWGTIDLGVEGRRTPEARSSLTPCKEGDEC